MATTLKTLRWADLAVGISIFVLAALTGCSSSPQTSSAPRSTSPTFATASAPMFSRIPVPSFDGPNVLPRSAVPLAKTQANVAAPSGPAAWRPRVAARDWKWIVIHHSATPSGSMTFFDKEHKAKGWDGVGYHFVIGNGTETGDGQVEVTQRWPLQKWGAHAKTVDNRFNEHGIGICLVGNFDVERPSPTQMRSLSQLVGHLMQTYRIPPQNVVGHRDTKPTDCPGRYVNLAWVRGAASGRASADADAETSVDASVDAALDTPVDAAVDVPMDARDGEIAPAQTASGVELLTDLPH